MFKIGSIITGGNIEDVANELSLHLSGSFAHSNQATAIRASSDQPLNSHPLDLNKHGQIEANINLTFNRPEERGNRNLFIHYAVLETNINSSSSIYTYIATNKLRYDGKIKQHEHSSTVVSSYRAFRWSAIERPTSRSSMPGQLNLFSPPRSPPLNALANDPLIPDQPQSHIKAPDILPPVINPIAPHLQIYPPAFFLQHHHH